MSAIASSPDPANDQAMRRLVTGLVLSLLAHAVLLSLRFHVPEAGMAAVTRLMVRLSPAPSMVPPAPPVADTVVPASVEPAPAATLPPAPGSGFTVVPARPKPVAAPAVAKPARASARRRAPKPAQRPALALKERVITQDINKDSEFAVPPPVLDDLKADAVAVREGTEQGTGMAAGKVDADAAMGNDEQVKSVQAPVPVDAEARQDDAAIALAREAERVAAEAQRREAEAAARVQAEQAQRAAAEAEQHERALAVQRRAEEDARRQADIAAQAERQRIAEAQARQQAEELARQQAERLAQQQAAEQARQQAERLAQQQAAEQARQQTERLAQQQVAEQARQQREQLAQQQAAEQARQQAERQAQQQAAEQAAEQARQQAERQAQQQAAEQARQQAERLAQQQAAEQARQQAERLAQQEAAELARQEAERLARQQAAEQARQQAQKLAEEQARADRERAASEVLRQGALAGKGSGAAGAGQGAIGGPGGAGKAAGGMPGTSLGSRAREMLRGLDVLGAPPPEVRHADAEPAARRRVSGGLERDVPLRLYIDSFRQKIERNGLLNGAQLSAGRVRIDPIVSVAIRSDGSVESVIIVRSSGHADIDAAVRRIVRLNERYGVFPPNVAVQFDVIEIRRIWTFAEGLKLIEEVR